MAGPPQRQEPRAVAYFATKLIAERCGGQTSSGLRLHIFAVGRLSGTFGELSRLAGAGPLIIGLNTPTDARSDARVGLDRPSKEPPPARIALEESFRTQPHQN